jgi:ribosomal protein L11 methyltransferase
MDSKWEPSWHVFLGKSFGCHAVHEKNNFAQHEIIIMPKMSFGTGHHQTTRLVCKAMFETDFNNKRVLDMGCGTGILAIFANFFDYFNLLMF